MINNFQNAQQDMRNAYGFGSTRYSNDLDYSDEKGLLEGIEVFRMFDF